MFPSGFFPKTYFVGVYFPPVDGVVPPVTVERFYIFSGTFSDLNKNPDGGRKNVGANGLQRSKAL